MSQLRIFQDTEGGQMSFSEDSHASHTAIVGSERERKMIDISGRTCLEQYEQCNPDGLWERTFTGLLLGTGDWSSMRCNHRWKLKATKSNRMYFQLQVSRHRVKDIEYSSSDIKKAWERIFRNDLIPTVMAQERGFPTEEQWKSRQEKYGGERRGMYLSYFLAKELIPTVTASGYKGGLAQNSKAFNKRKEHHRGVELWEWLQRKLDGQTFQLSPLFCLEMMGFPLDWTLKPFLIASGSSRASKEQGTQ